MKTATTVCGRCGAKVSGDGTREVCPACLLESGLVAQPGCDDGVRVAVKKKAAHPVRMLADFGDYELLEEIGRGGQGVVYRAHQKSLNRTVALKVIGLGPWTTEAHLKRFRREAEAAARLEHPSIVPIHEVGERDGQCYFSMKFVEGGQLDDVVKREPIPIRRAVELIAKLARTVQYAHEHGILHRDIKPGNILLDEQGEPHLTDFGLARLVEAGSTITHTLEVMGTPSYMSPEQAAGEHTKVSSTTDVYGLGAVLYELLTGHPPFVGGTSYQTIRLLLDTEPRQPRLWNRKIDRELSTISLKCLEKDPKRRYSSAFALAEDLEHWLKHEPIQAKPSGFFTRSRKWVQRKPAIAALIVASIGLAAAMGWNVWKSELFRAPPEKSIAVLPFKNLSEEKQNEYFSDGITEEILNALAQIPNLKVAARRSAFQFKGNDLDLRKIGQILGVAHILEGSLQKAGDQVRINVQLVDVKNGLQAWSEKYDRKLDNVFAVEDEIAKAIATKLRVQLTGGAGQPLVVDSTNNPQAHELYLRGLTLLAARGPGLRDASDSFQQAVKLDAGYAQAWGALAITDLLLPAYGLDSFEASLPRGEAAAQRALSLDPNTASAQIAVGLADTIRFRWPEADQAFRRALVLAPGDAEAVNQYAQFLGTVGQLEPCLREIERAQQLDPLSPIIGVIHAGALAALRRDDAAEAQIKKVLAAHPEFRPAQAWGAAQYIDRKMYPEAEAALRASGKLNGQNGDAKALLARGMADPAQRVAAVNSLETSPDNTDIRQDTILYAFFLVSLGERNRALDELEIYAVKHNSGFAAWLWNRAFDPLRDEPRFKAVLAKLALPYTPPAVTEP